MRNMGSIFYAYATVFPLFILAVSTPPKPFPPHAPITWLFVRCRNGIAQLLRPSTFSVFSDLFPVWICHKSLLLRNRLQGRIQNLGALLQEQSVPGQLHSRTAHTAGPGKTVHDELARHGRESNQRLEELLRLLALVTPAAGRDRPECEHIGRAQIAGLPLLPF